MTTSRTWRTHVTVLIVSLLLAGCAAAPPASPATGGSPVAPATDAADPESPPPAEEPGPTGESPAGETPADETEGPAEQTAAAPESPPAGDGWTLSIAFSSDISSLDPHIAYDAYSWPVVQAIFEPLLGYDPEGNVIPLLAESMPEVSDDGLTFTFTLREGVHFVSRDGEQLREITADDVLFSLNRLLNPNLRPTPSPVSSYFFAIIEGAQAVIDGEASEATGIRALDERTVEITITEPNQAFLNILALPFGSVVPHEFATEDTAAFSNEPVGSGAFYLESYTPGQQAVLLANPHYWNPDPGRASRVEYFVDVDANSQLQRVQTGSLHIAGDPIPPGQYTATVNDARWADMIQRMTIVAVDYVSMDTTGEGPLSNVQVRQAINHAIDKEHILRLDNNRGTVAGCVFPTELPGHNPDCNPYPYDPQRARVLLEEAGFGDGFSTTLYTYEDEPGPEFAESISQDLAEVGIEVEVVVQPFETLLETIATPHNAPMVLIGWFQDFPDPSDFIDPLFACSSAVEGGVNISWYCNEELDRQSAEARAHEDQDERLAMYQELEIQIMDEAPIVPIRYPEVVHLVSDEIDFEFHPIWLFDLATPRLRDGG